MLSAHTFRLSKYTIAEANSHLRNCEWAYFHVAILRFVGSRELISQSPFQMLSHFVRYGPHSRGNARLDISHLILHSYPEYSFRDLS